MPTIITYCCRVYLETDFLSKNCLSVGTCLLSRCLADCDWLDLLWVAPTGQLVAEVPSGLSLTPPQETKYSIRLKPEHVPLLVS
jgi:hypothetical protein